MSMFQTIKRRLYFVVASYFAFWAKITLRRWQPRIIVITGSTGKTTLLHLIEAQLGEEATYSHHANTAVGIPLHILGLGPNITARYQWFGFVVAAPFRAWRRLPQTKLYVVEADTDRAGGDRFLAPFLKPEVTLWVSVDAAHAMEFDKLVQNAQFATHEEAIAHEAGYFVAATTSLVVAPDQPAITQEIKRDQPKALVKFISSAGEWVLTPTETIYKINQQEIHLKGLHPEALGRSLQMVHELLSYLHKPLDPYYPHFVLPPGRSSIFAGKNHLTLLDSTYNASLGSMTAILDLFNAYPAAPKWLVISDILEQGSLEQVEHEHLAEAILKVPVGHIVLLGPRCKKYTYPILKQRLPQHVPVVAFESPKDVLDYLKAHLRGGEAILFKGARFLEGVIEQLLADPADASKLVRRDATWIKRRQSWGLPK